MSNHGFFSSAPEPRYPAGRPPLRPWWLAFGGSFPAAYYALHGAETFKEFPGKFLYRPVQSDLIKRALSPASWLKLAGSSYGRSDLAADYYDEKYYANSPMKDQFNSKKSDSDRRVRRDHGP